MGRGRDGIFPSTAYFRFEQWMRSWGYKEAPIVFPVKGLQSHVFLCSCRLFKMKMVVEINSWGGMGWGVGDIDV